MTIEQEVANAAGRAANAWLDATGLDEDELNQYDLWEQFAWPYRGDEDAPGLSAWVKGTTEDYNFADLKIMRAINYLFDSEDPQVESYAESYNDYFARVVIELLPLASPRLIKELGTEVDISRL